MCTPRPRTSTSRNTRIAAARLRQLRDGDLSWLQAAYLPGTPARRASSGLAREQVGYEEWTKKGSFPNAEWSVTVDRGYRTACKKEPAVILVDSLPGFKPIFHGVALPA